MSQLDLNELLNENERLGDENQGGGNFLNNFVKMPDGNGVVLLRLLPPAKKGMFGNEKNPFYAVTRIHSVNGKKLHCPRELVDKRWQGECPICRYYSWLWKESEKPNVTPDEAKKLQAQARAIKPIERYYYNALVRVETDSNGQVQKNVGPKILSVGKTVHGMVIRAIVGDKELQEKPLGDVTDPVNGRDFKIMKVMRKSGSESYPNYSDSKFVDPSPLGTKEEVEKWLGSLHDLKSLRIIKNADELKHELKVHLGIIEETKTDGFDPSEFQKGTPKVVVAEKPEYLESKAVSDTQQIDLPTKTNVTDLGSDEESLADDEFMKSLRDMGA